MRLKLPAVLPLACVVALTLLSACGNKRELFLVPDEVTQQDLLRLEQALEAESAPTDEVGTSEKGEDEVKKDKTKNASSS
ncbi:MAG: putative small lipoprotein YifL [Granulosicoccus sp.]|jgi:predicted small lipoprotein YifL